MYSRILVAVDLTEECRTVAQRAATFSQMTGAELHIVHVIEPLSLAYGGDIPMDLSTVQESINDQAQSYLSEFSVQFDIPEANQHLLFGKPEREIERLAVENSIDVISLAAMLDMDWRCCWVQRQTESYITHPVMLWRCVLAKIAKRQLHFFILVLPLILLSGRAVIGNEDLSVYEQRLAYIKAKQALRVGRSSEYRSIRESLRGYVLEPYLIYYENQGRLSALKPEKILDLREQLSSTTLGERLFEHWLAVQASRQRWSTYAEYYEGSNDGLAACNYLRALFHLARNDEMKELAPTLWVVGESQPKACDPPFARWIKDGHVTNEIAWERLKLALDGRSWQLARYLFRFFSSSVQSSGRTLYNVHREPSRAKNPRQFKNDRWGREAWLHGLIRLARTDAFVAKSTFLDHRDRFDFEEVLANSFESDLAFWLAREGVVPDAVKPAYSLATRMAIIDTLISQEHWELANDWLETLPDEEVAKYKWRFWRGYIQHKLDTTAPSTLLDQLAKERTYYGFLAADVIGVPSSMNPRDPNSYDMQVLDDDRIQLVLELFAVDDRQNAELEWKKLIPSLNLEQKTVLVHQFHVVGMNYDAILAANQTDLLDLIHVRFPMPYLHLFRRYAHQTNLDLGFLLAIARQESAFNPRAISPVGARGLMQLMRSTARISANQIRAPAPDSQSLLDPTVSVQLGTHHVADLMSEFANNRVLVAASYNAGSNRVKQWLREMPAANTLSWIERIPFAETRNYVKNVVAISHVYSHRLNELKPVLHEHEQSIGTRN